LKKNPKFYRLNRDIRKETNYRLFVSVFLFTEREREREMRTAARFHPINTKQRTTLRCRFFVQEKHQWLQATSRMHFCVETQKQR